MKVLVLGSAIAAVFQAPSLEIDQAVDIAVQNAFSVRIAQSNVTRQRDLIQQAAAALGIRLTVTGQYTRYDKPQVPFPGSPGKSDSKQASATISLPIDIAGVVRLAVASARFSEMAAVEAMKAEMNGIRGQVRAAFLNSLRAKAQIKVRQDSLENAKRRLAQAELRLRTGDAPRFDVLRLQTEVSQAQAAVISANTLYQTSKQGLNNVMARPAETPFEPVEVQFEVWQQPDPAPLVSAGQKNRPEIKSGEMAVLAARYRTRYEAGGLKPSLTLSATATHNFDPFSFQRRSVATGLATISIPVLDGGITRARVKASEQDEAQAKIRVEQTRLAVSLEIRNALLQLENARQTLQVATIGLEQAKEAYRIAQLRFENGEGILLDVTSAQESLTLAETSLIQARYDYLGAVSELQRSVGQDALSINPAASSQETPR